MTEKIDLEGFSPVPPSVEPEPTPAPVEINLEGFSPVSPTVEQEPTSDMSFFESLTNQAVRAYNQFGDIASGVNAGIVGVPQGIAELGAIGIDYTFDTNTLESTTNGFRYLKNLMGFTPTTTAGKSAEAISNFAGLAIPVAGVLNRASLVARGDKVIKGTSTLARAAETIGTSTAGKALLRTRPRQAVTTTFAMGASDFIASTDGSTHLADAWDALPDALETEPDTGLHGREEAKRNFRNKARHFVEGAGITAAFEVAFPTIGLAAKTALANPASSYVAHLVTSGFDSALKAVDEKLPAKFTENFKKYFTFAGNVPKELREKLTDAQSFEFAITDAAANNYKLFDESLKSVIKGQKLFGKGRQGVREGRENLSKFLQGLNKDGSVADGGFSDALKEYGPMVEKSGQKMKDQIIELTDIIAKQLDNAPDISGKDKEKLFSIFEDTRNAYITRDYAEVLDPEKVVTVGTKENKVYQDAISEVSEILRKTNPDLSEQELRQFSEQTIRDIVYKETIETGLDPLQAAKEIKKNLAAGVKESKGQTALFRISERFFEDRNALFSASPSLRQVAGQRFDTPYETYLTTVGNMSRLIASNDMYDDIAVRYMKTFDEALDDVNKGTGGPLIVSGANLDLKQITTLKSLGYRPLGEFDTNKYFGGTFGSLSGSYVKPGLQDALTTPQRLFSDGVLGGIYDVFLQSKGISQMTKTVLSPLAIVRNAISGIFMLGANGNVIRSTNLWDSMRLTLAKSGDLSEEEFRVFYDKMGALGIRDQNIVVNEFRRLLQEGGKTPSYAGAEVGLQRKINKIPGVKMFQDIYSGTDTFWKIAGISAENAKFSSALQKSGINPEQIPVGIQEALINGGVAGRSRPLGISEQANITFLDTLTSDIVKATMPTYSRVPRIVKGSQRIPVFGNFVAFPSEIIRNTANILNQSVREMGFRVTDDLTNAFIQNAKDIARLEGRQIADDVARQIGEKAARRFAKEVRGIGAKRASSYIATALVLPTALQKTTLALTGATQEELDAMQRVIPEFMKGQTVLFLEKPENGKATYLNYSYMNPYDYLLNPFRQALDVYNQKGELQQSEIDKLTQATLVGIGGFMEPFTSESLVAERLLDVTTRGGRTDTGAFVYRKDSDSGIIQFQKSINHILGGFTPGIVEQAYEIRGGTVKAGRYSRAFTGDPTAQGVVTTPQEEILTTLTGFRRLDLDLPNQLRYIGGEYSRRRSSAISGFRNVVNANDSTEQDVVDSYVRENENLKRIQQEFYQAISAAKTLGMPEDEIFEYLKEESKLGTKELEELLFNTFSPIKPTDNMAEVPFYETEIKEQPRVLEELPMDRLDELYDEFLEQPLIIEKPEKFSGFAPEVELNTEETPTFDLKDFTPVTPSPEPQAMAPVQAPVAAPTQAVAAIPRTSPTLVPNLRTQQLAQDLETRRG